MFASTLTRPARKNASPSSMYQMVGFETGVSGASPHRLVCLLFDALLESISVAQGAIRSGDLETKGRAVGRATKILEEGLKAALNPAGGEVATNLSNLYGYVITRLLQAHLRNDQAAFDECRNLIQPVRDAWYAIGSRVPA